MLGLTPEGLAVECNGTQEEEFWEDLGDHVHNVYL